MRGRLKKVKDKKEQRRELAAKIEAQKLEGVKGKKEEEDLITIIQTKKEVDETEEEYDESDEGEDLF